MRQGFTWFRRLGRNARGANAIEYCVIGGVVAVSLVAAAGALGVQPSQTFENVAERMEDSIPSSGPASSGGGSGGGIGAGGRVGD
jgi:Flp pilus assembly pilin Flp